MAAGVERSCRRDVGRGAPAFAQDAEQVSQVQDIVVTGSRIRQRNLETTSPVVQVTGEDIAVAGVTRVEDLVAQLPQAFAAQNSTVSNGASGTATVSLRNLGPSRTLVLIDGRRMGYGSPNDSAADLNQIPEQLVERVEVLTGGASAIYGSDAMAGVVNFIMKKNFEGLQVDAQYGFYQHNNDYSGPGNLRNVIAERAKANPSQFRLPDDNVVDGESSSVNAILGMKSADGRGSLIAYAGYRKNNPILGGGRDYSSCAIGETAANGNDFTCGGSGTAFPGQFFDLATETAYTVGGRAGVGNGTFEPYSAENGAYNFGPSNYFQRPDERYTLGAFGTYQLNDKAEAYTQLMFSDYSSVAQIAPSGAFLGPVTKVSCSNPLLSAQQAATVGCAPGVSDVDMLIGRRNVEGGGRQDSISYTSYRGVVGVRGALNENWNYDVAAQLSRVRLSRNYLNDFSKTRLARALDVVNVGGVPTCRSVTNNIDPACVPYDIFSVGGVTQEALRYLQTPLNQTGETTQQILSAVVSGDTGFGLPTAESNIQVAVGGEYRRDSLKSVPDNSFATNDGAGQGGPTIGFEGSASVIEGFVELQVPLVDNKPWAYKASLDAAYRQSQYFKFDASTYKVGFDYAPIQDVRMRASYSRAIRAPNIIESFAAQGFNLFDLDYDPCSQPGRTANKAGSVPATCVGTNPWQVTAGQSAGSLLNNPSGQYNYLQGGNQNLSPEQSDTFTLGFVVTPRILPGFNLSLDYFDIKVDNLIGRIGAQNVLDACYTASNAQACSQIKRDPATGSFWLNEGHVADTNVNIGGVRTSGIDVNANYGFDLERLGAPSYGSLAFSFAGTWLKKLETDTGLGLSNSVYDCAGFYANQCGVPNPEWRHRARATWVSPWNVDVSATWRYYGSVEIAVLGADGSLGNSGPRLDRELEQRNYLDLALSWQATEKLKVRAGVNNVLDKDPPLSASVGTTGNNNTYPQLYDAMGRYMFVGVTATF